MSNLLKQQVMDTTIKDLIKQGKLSEGREYNFVVNLMGKLVHATIEMYNNRVYFFAKVYGHELPFRNYRITRKTTLRELRNDINKWMLF